MRRSFSFRNRIVSLLLAGLLVSLALPEREVRIHILPDSEVVISGTSNVNAFSCVYRPGEAVSELPVAYQIANARYRFQSARLELRNDCFDCGGRMINRDFRTMLQTEVFPEIQLDLLSARFLPHSTTEVSAQIGVTLAGVNHTYQAVLQCEGEGAVCVSGKVPMRLSDFRLQPPKKAMGLIRVADDIQVHLNIQLQILE